MLSGRPLTLSRALSGVCPEAERALRSRRRAQWRRRASERRRLQRRRSARRQRRGCRGSIGPVECQRGRYNRGPWAGIIMQWRGNLGRRSHRDSRGPCREHCVSHCFPVIFRKMDVSFVRFCSFPWSTACFTAARSRCFHLCTSGIIGTIAWRCPHLNDIFVANTSHTLRPSTWHG